jgi:uncharacterized damage-inducible protein DinB
MTTDPRYPIGKFQAPAAHTPESRAKMIAEIAAAPAALRAALSGLSPSQVETPYREGGWTVRQVAHHVPDSHLNAYVRIRLALTEENPTVKPYDEAKWAELPDVKTVPVEVSLSLLESLHTRWVALLKSMTPAQWARTYNHPEYGKVTMEWVLSQYAWHGKHHVAQITTLRGSKGW